MVSLYTTTALSSLDANDPAHPWGRQHFENAVSHIAEAFEKGKIEGVVRPDAPSHQLAQTFVALLDGIQIQWLCARADACHSAEDYDPTPSHGTTQVDMASQLRLLIDMLKTRWRP